MFHSAKHRCLLIAVACLLPVTGPQGRQPDSELRFGLTPFKDSGSVPTYLIQPAKLQENLARILSADFGLTPERLQPMSPTGPQTFDPDTQMIPPALRSGRWRGTVGSDAGDDWFEQGRKKELSVVVAGSYEVFNGSLRYFAEGFEPLSRRSSFACRVEGTTSEMFSLESQLAEKIAQQLTAQATSEAKGLGPNPAIIEEIPTPLPSQELSAEGHYENGFALTRRFDQTNDPKYLEGAEEEYRAALAKDANHFRSLNNLGTVLHRQGRYQEAIGYYHRVLELNSRYVRAMENAALAYRALGQDDPAIEMWKRALLFEDREEVRKVIEETLDKLLREKNALNLDR